MIAIPALVTDMTNRTDDFGRKNHDIISKIGDFGRKDND